MRKTMREKGRGTTMSKSTPLPESIDAVRAGVREHYAASARSVAERAKSCCGPAQVSPLAIKDYDPAAVADLPQDAVLASLGCGNPTALAELDPGETVLDLGSGGGIDVLLSAKRVGPTGFVYGLDMTDEMLALAERNRAEAGIENVRFLKGHIEAIPLPDESVDVIISNCVINLSGDKDQVLREAFRVLRPGGRFAVSDIVVQGRLLPAVRQNLAFWSACVSGALSEADYHTKLAEAGFEDVGVEVTSVYTLADLADDEEGCCGAGADCCGTGGASSVLLALADAQDRAGKIVSAFVRARKPTRP
jgi:SAM-dependent methyltransferase